MDGPGRSGAGRDRRLILAAILGLVLLLVIGAIAYLDSDDLIDRAKALITGQTGRAQGRFHY
jgi:hypothetical protein